MPAKAGGSKAKAAPGAAPTPAKRSAATSKPAPKAAAKPAAKAPGTAPVKPKAKVVAKRAVKPAATAPAKAAKAPASKTARDERELAEQRSRRRSGEQTTTTPKGPKAPVRAPVQASAKLATAKPATAPPRAAKAVASKESARVKVDAGGTVRKVNFDKEALGAIRQRLMDQRRELQDQLETIEQSALGLSQSEMSGEVSYDEDYADAGSFTFEREKEFSIANNVTDLRSKIDRALHKIQEGSYGICESCGQPIEAQRLKALPHVTLCLKCKKAEERR